jgi:regulator of protease activity HflC (stomatin/prohibitin superfamily)
MGTNDEQNAARNAAQKAKAEAEAQAAAAGNTDAEAQAAAAGNADAEVTDAQNEAARLIADARAAQGVMEAVGGDDLVVCDDGTVVRRFE